MNTRRWIVDVTLGGAVIALAVVVWAQHAEIARLDEAFARLEARVAVDVPRPDPQRAGEPSATISRAPAVAPRTTPAPAPNPAPADETVRPAHGPAAAAVVAFDPEDPIVRSQLREVIAQEEEARQDERWQQREARREARLRERIAELAQTAALDAMLTEQLTDLLVVEQAEVGQIFREAREDFSWEDARERAAAVRAETDAKAREILDPEALEEYEKMRAEETNRWRGPGRGPAPGPRANPR